MKPYVIKQGDFLRKVAFKMGFDPDAIWNDPSNADLKKKRASGDILQPGDLLYVPEQPREKNPFTKESKNAYKAKLPTVSVKIALKAPGGKAIANEPYVIKGLAGGDDEEPEEKTTDGDGNVSFEAPITIKQVELVLTKRKKTFHLLVGGLDPVNEPSGAKMRLEHLGFYGSTFDGGGDPYPSRDAALLAAALKAFQNTSGLPITGLLDEITQDAIKKAHGS